MAILDIYVFGIPSADAREVGSPTNHQLQNSHIEHRKVNIMSIKVLVHMRHMVRLFYHTTCGGLFVDV